MDINTRQSMAGVLSDVEGVCQQHGVERVACVPFGFEDEGVVLDQWRRRNGPPLKLDIYCETRGDVVAFDGCVDELPKSRLQSYRP
ncbi:MAG: hypothetical protein NT154_09815 [Verrucomicrobia bacterium]|nr:hypothetical protein [Verrucomicrobiota bacterium]